MEHFDTIHNSPSQIYQSALSLSPPSSWLYKNYIAELLQAPGVVKGAELQWGKCSRIVLLDTLTQTLSYWDNVIAVGSEDGNIITLDAITGTRKAVLSGHSSAVNCVIFSSDGRSLASGGNDNTVKLWDIQTGGIVKTFHGHTGPVGSVSISTDYTKIVSGSRDDTVCLWDIQTGECLCTIKEQAHLMHVSFSPIDHQHIFSIADDQIQEWDLNGQQISSTHGNYITFSSDHTMSAFCIYHVVVVQVSDSEEDDIELPVDAERVECCCFSPDGRLVAAAANSTAYVWDITNPDFGFVEMFVGHTAEIRSLVFSSPSSLISLADDRSVRFWQIGVLPTDPVKPDPKSTPLVPSRVRSVSLHARNRIAISSDDKGVVKIWDILTGICKKSFQTPAGDNTWRDVRQIDDKFIVTWRVDNQIHIWDTNKDDPKKVVTFSSSLWGLRISGDGSIVFLLLEKSIQAWSIHTETLVGEVKLELEQGFYLDPLQIDGSKIWIRLKDFSTQGWDFGVLNSPPVILSDESAERPLLDFIGGTYWQTKSPSMIKNTVTGKKVFPLSGRYVEPEDIEWDGQYLVAGYESGEVLIMDFHDLCSQ